ncbi:hypothetical protein KR032_006585, partial [Drosophila birchii]
MNDLNLRVAALKLCAHPKRFAELRDALVPLPERWSSATYEFVQQFATATSSAEQVLVVKDLFYKEQEDPDQAVEHFLANLLLASPLKHAVRNQLTKLFSDNALAKQAVHRRSKDSLLAALRQSLREMTSSLESTSVVSHDRFNDVFVSANACLQNFPFGREALGDEMHLFMPLLPRALERYWTDISDARLELSPTRRNELYLYVQNALRFQVSLLSEWSGDRWPVTLLQATDVVAQRVARHVDTPWDVRSIAGLLIGHLARSSGRFREYLDCCSKPQAERDLPIQMAALLVLQPLDYTEYGPQALAILQLILAIAETEGNVSNLLVYLSKHLFIYSKSLGDLPASQEVVQQRILAQLQCFALQHISDATDSVRHMSSALFRQVLQHAQASKQEELFQVVYRQFEGREAPLNASCLALEQLTGVLGVDEALRQCPSLFGVIFPRYLGCEDSVDSLFKGKTERDLLIFSFFHSFFPFLKSFPPAMMISAHKTQPFVEWQKLWFGQLLAATRVQDKRRSAIEQLLTQAVQLEPQALAQVLLRNDDSDEEARLPLSSKLAAILSVRQLSERRQEMLRHLKLEVEEALLGLDDHTRLLALRFVVETPRPSEPLTQAEAEAIALYLRYNANNPSAHLRQLGYGLLQKALKRINLGLAEHQKRPTPVGDELLRLLTNLMVLLSRNLFPTANYGRRWLSLHLLRDCVDLCRRLQLSEVEQQLPPEALTNLEHCLGDSYEQNKLLAAQLLQKLQTRSRLQPDKMMELLLSLRPPDSATGAFQLQVYCRAKEVEAELPVQLEEEVTGHEPRIHRALQWCMQHLREGLALAQQDLAEAAKLNPLYGLLFASRHLLQQLRLKELAREPSWRRYIHQLVDLCLEVSRVVLPVVSSASPEGHLPETRDQELDQPLLSNVFSRRLPSEALQQVRTTPQMVLLCAWRSIKEVSLILGELVQRAPLEEEQEKQGQDFLLANAQLEEIGELFLLLLAETKHRGAFEQAYVGFTLLCRRFWHSDAVRLNQLPDQWVNEAMAMVSGEMEQHQAPTRRLCSTRRSAGMPFMLQALICTELKLGTHATLHRCMQRLLEVCERRSPGPAAITARSHALNIMRALFRCSELAELVTEFVALGIQCALESLLRAEEWSERNCATLLLAALVVRVFGVERARLETGELHVRNRMTGRIFFTRYPQLFDYFHAGLQREAELMIAPGTGGKSSGKRRQTVQLEAMLLMLSRLYPSSLEGAESTLNLSEFVPFLLKICSSHDLMTRERAALVVANFVSQERALAEIRRIVLKLKVLQLKLSSQDSVNLDANHCHGQLLLLLHLQRLARWTHPSLTRLQLHTLSALAEHLLHRDICLFSALLDVMVAIMEDVIEPGLVGGQLLEQMASVYRLDHADVYKRCQEQGISTRFYQIFCLHLHRLQANVPGIIRHMIEDLAISNLPAALDELKVELWLYLLLQRSIVAVAEPALISDLDIEHFQFAADIRRYYDTLQPVQRQEVAQLLYGSQEIRSCVLLMVTSPERCWNLALVGRLAALQPLFKDSGLQLEEVIGRCSAQTPLASQQQPGLVLALKRLIRESSGELETDHWLPLLDYSLRLIDPIQPVYLRHQAAELCDLLAGSHLAEQMTSNVEVMGRFMRLVLLLLLDEAEWVRHRAAQLVASSKFQRELGQKLAKDERNVLPSALIPEFLSLMLANLQKQGGGDAAYLQRLFQLIAEPFFPREAHVDGDVDGEDVEVFDKQEINLYCESLLVLSEI